jgi:acyl-CoA thioester hydrolase
MYGELTYSTKVYYDDTDAGGVVYYANYLKWCERAKQEFFLKNSCDLFKLHYENIYLVVKEVNANYIKSVELGETVDIYVSVKELKKASLILHFDISVGEEIRASIDILSVAIKKGSKIIKLPDCVKNL